MVEVRVWSLQKRDGYGFDGTYRTGRLSVGDEAEVSVEDGAGTSIVVDLEW